MAATAHYLTPTVVKVELLCSGHSLGFATGFFLKRNGRWRLMTNWHVVSGRHPDTGQPIHASGGTPDRLRYWVAAIPSEVFEWSAHEIDLGDALQGTATWFQHPTLGQAIDIASLDVEQSAVGHAKDLLEPGGHDENMFIDLGGELFIPGYPLGLASAGSLALWKRASLASSLEYGEGINRYFYVDTATRSGMSGAPCLAVSNWKYYRRDPETLTMSVVNDLVSWRFMGVYSGRMNASDSFEAQIGMVWRDFQAVAVADSTSKAFVRIS